MATFVRHEPCPRCGSRDNLGRYSDGSAWCFGCQLAMQRSDSGGLHNSSHTPVKDNDELPLPDDLGFDYPRHVVDWLDKYGISVAEGIKHGWKYTKKFDQLLFIFKDGDERVTCTQARNFSPQRAARRKYYNQGSPADVLPIFRYERWTAGSPRYLVITEDAVSAAKISRQSDAMPCLGSYLPARKIMALKVLNYETLLVWLDADKLKEARHIEDMAKWVGLSSRTIYTEKDPKEYSDDEIVSLLRGGTLHG